MYRRFVLWGLLVALTAWLPFSAPAPLTFVPGEGWYYEPYGQNAKWQRTRAKDQLDVAEQAFTNAQYSITLHAAHRVVRVWPLSDYAPRAQYLIGRALEATGKDEAAFEEYRTKRVILEIYDEMQTAMETGVPYQTRLDPPPANGWVPPTELLQFEADAATEPALPGREEDIGAGAVREQRAQYGSAGNASDLELVAPPSTPLTEPVPALDISTGEVKTDWSTRVRVNGKLGFLISEGTAPDGSRIVTVQLDGDEKPRKFVSPPALVERLG